MRIASLDPGTKSGLVLWEGDGGRKWSGAEVDQGLKSALEVRVEDGWLLSSHVIAHTIRTWDVDLLLYEEFMLSGGGGHSSDPEALDSVRVTSAVLGMLMAWQSDRFVNVVGFSPSIKAVMTDSRMKLWGLWLQGKDVSVGGKPAGACKGFEGHATDAARGLVWYLREVIQGEAQSNQSGMRAENQTDPPG